MNCSWKHYFRTAAVVAAGMLVAAPAFSADDFGAQVEQILKAQSTKLFGVTGPLDSPATIADVVTPRSAAAANQRVKLASGLQAEFVARNVASLGDMISFWPTADAPTHLMICIEQGRTPGGSGANTGRNAAVQRVNLATKSVENILYGMDRCDGIRTTAWGTVLATEETDDGRAYEIIDPLGTTGHWAENRSTGLIRTAFNGATTSTKVVQRPALPTMAWEGLEVLPNGVVIGGDELRPGDDGNLDADGGAIFKFIPDSPHTSGTISDLANSPLAAGKTYAMTISCQAQSSSSFPQYGQGCEIGSGAWVRVNALTARADADANGATGYYRPEDLHRDPTYEGHGLKFCWTNTGNSGANNFAEVVCAVDSKPLPQVPMEWEDSRTGFFYLTDNGTSRSAITTVLANRFIEGDERFNAHDNLEIQPHTGVVYVIEDASFGEVFACLPDGSDRDIKSDGCVSILSVADNAAEPTGFIFDGSGTTAYVIVQHGLDDLALRDMNSNPINGQTDDLIKITGFKLK